MVRIHHILIFVVRKICSFSYRKKRCLAMPFDLNNSLILFILWITLSWNNFLLQIIEEYSSGNVSVTPCHHRGGRKFLLDVVSRFSCSCTDITESASFGCKSTANEEFRVVRLVQQTERHRVVGVWKMISRKTTRLLNALIDSSAIFLRSYVRCHSNDFSSIFSSTNAVIFLLHYTVLRYVYI